MRAATAFHEPYNIKKHERDLLFEVLLPFWLSLATRVKI